MIEMGNQINTSWWSCLPGSISQLFRLTVGLILTCVVLMIIHLFQRRQKLLNAFRDFPGPPAHWLYGHIYKWENGGELRSVAKWTETFPRCFPLWFGRFVGGLLINHPEYAREVLSRGDPKHTLTHKFFLPFIGKGLILLDGTKWQQHRKLLTPGFHNEILKPYVTLIAESVKVMLDKWEKGVSEDPEASVEIYKDVCLMTLDSNMKCAFSFHSNCQMDRDNPYAKAIFDITYLITERMKIPLYQSNLIYWFTSQGHQFRKACRVSHCHTDRVIRERQKSLKDNNESILKKKHLDFLDILLLAKDEKGRPLPHEDIRAEADTFLAAGHDTSTSAISWLFYCMAQNPEHQQKCREEIKALLEDQDTIKWDHLRKMTYTTMCIKETLRIYPPISVMLRLLKEPLTFHDGRTLPEDLLVGISIYGIHRNPEIWNNPEAFDPMRFSPENSHSRHPYAFLPFSAGSRNCIGQQFALTEMKVALALTLLKFELKLDPAKPTTPVVQIVTSPENGMYLKLKKLPPYLLSSCNNLEGNYLCET
ncbi:cytochrome P450 4B1-like [Pogona vitticeps]